MCTLGTPIRACCLSWCPVDPVRATRWDLRGGFLRVCRWHACCFVFSTEDDAHGKVSCVFLAYLSSLVSRMRQKPVFHEGVQALYACFLQFFVAPPETRVSLYVYPLDCWTPMAAADSPAAAILLEHVLQPRWLGPSPPYLRYCHTPRKMQTCLFYIQKRATPLCALEGVG